MRASTESGSPRNLSRSHPDEPEVIFCPSKNFCSSGVVRLISPVVSADPVSANAVATDTTPEKPEFDSVGLVMP